MKFFYILIFSGFLFKSTEMSIHGNSMCSNSINKPTKILQDFILQAIKVQDIKSKIDDVTTSFIPKSKSKFFPNKQKNQYYAGYYLIKKQKDLTSKLIGRMIVYDSINPKFYNKSTEEFIEITLIEEGIVLYNKFEVGMTEQKLLSIINKKDCRRHNNTIEIIENKLRAFFQVNNHIVTKIKIGSYRDNVDVENMLREFNWNKKDGF
jgi:hypothetical protein